jgi:hypothetical protein
MVSLGKIEVWQIHKKSEQIWNSPLQHSTSSFLNFINSKKRNLDEEKDKSRIAWSRLGNEYTDALMSYDSNVADKNLTNQPAASVVNNYSGNAYCNVKEIISYVHHKYSIIKHVITINSL